MPAVSEKLRQVQENLHKGAVNRALANDGLRPKYPIDKTLVQDQRAAVIDLTTGQVHVADDPLTPHVELIATKAIKSPHVLEGEWALVRNGVPDRFDPTLYVRDDFHSEPISTETVGKITDAVVFSARTGKTTNHMFDEALASGKRHEARTLLTAASITMSRDTYMNAAKRSGAIDEGDQHLAQRTDL